MPAGGRVGELVSFDRSIGGVLAGFDEAGRGALAGPLAVAAVSLDLESGIDYGSFLYYLDDSKRVTANRREELFSRITAIARFGIGFSSASEIDRLGIIEAARLAARRAYLKMSFPVDLALLDRGLTLVEDAASPSPVSLPSQLILTHGDSRSFHIACASILAKVARDRLMRALDERFPGYALSRHKGYGTAAHREAIRRLGRSKIHRGSFIHPERG